MRAPVIVFITVLFCPQVGDRVTVATKVATANVSFPAILLPHVFRPAAPHSEYWLPKGTELDVRAVFFAGCSPAAGARNNLHLSLW
jgi:hypothetical protein